MVVPESDTVERKFSIPKFLGIDYLCVKGIQLVEASGEEMTLQEIYPYCDKDASGYCDSQSLLGQSKSMTFVRSYYQNFNNQKYFRETTGEEYYFKWNDVSRLYYTSSQRYNNNDYYLFWHASEELLGYLPAMQFDSTSTKKNSYFNVSIELTFVDDTIYTTPQLSFLFICSEQNLTYVQESWNTNPSLAQLTIGLLDKSQDPLTISLEHLKVRDYFKTTVSNCFISGYINMMDQDPVYATYATENNLISHEKIELVNGKEPLNAQLLVNRIDSQAYTKQIIVHSYPMEQLDLAKTPNEITHKIFTFQIFVCGQEILKNRTETTSGQSISEVKYFLLIDKGVDTTYINIVYEQYKEWFQVVSPENEAATWSDCFIKEYMFCQDQTCDNVIPDTSSTTHEFTVWGVEADAENGFEDHIFISVTDNSTNPVSEGDILQIDHNSWQITQVQRGINGNESTPYLEYIDPALCTTVVPDEPLAEGEEEEPPEIICPDQEELLMIRVNTTAQGAQTVRKLHQTRKVLRGDTVTIICNPSYQPTNEAAFWIWARNRGDHTITKKIDFRKCDENSMSLNETGATYEIVLAKNNEDYFLNKTDFIDFIDNSCEDTCPKTFNITERNDTLHVNEKVTWNNSGITVNPSQPQLYDLQIRGEYYAEGEFSDCSKLTPVSFPFKLQVCGDEIIKPIDDEPWQHVMYVDRPEKKTFFIEELQAMFQVEEKHLTEKCLEFNVTILNGDKEKFSESIYIDEEEGFLTIDGFQFGIPENISFSLQATTILGSVSITKEVHIGFGFVPKNKAPYFSPVLNLPDILISANGDMLKKGSEQQYFTVKLPEIFDDEGDSPIIDLVLTIACNCITATKNEIKLDKKRLSESDVGIHIVQFKMYDVNSRIYGLVTEFQAVFDIQYTPPTPTIIEKVVELDPEKAAEEEEAEQIDSLKEDPKVSDQFVGAKVVLKPIIPAWVIQMTEAEFAKKEQEWLASLKSEEEESEIEIMPLEVVIQKVTRDGQIQFKFNQDIHEPDLIKEAKKGSMNINKRSLSSLDSIDIGKIFGIYFVMKSDVAPEAIEFFLNLEKWEGSDVWLRVNFNQPLLVSKGGLKDLIQILIKKPSFFRAKLGGHQLDESQLFLSSEIETQVPLGVDPEAMEESVEQFQSAVYGIIVVQIVASVFLKGGMNELLSLFYTLQVIVALKVYDTALPANIDIFVEQTKEVVQFEFLKPDKILSLVWPDFDMFKAFGLDKNEMGDSLLSQAGAFITVGLVAIFVLISLLLVRAFKKYQQKIDKFIKENKQKYIWNGILKQQTISYVQLLTSLVGQCKRLASGYMNTKKQMLIEILSISPLLVFFPLACFFIIYYNWKRLEKQEFKDKFGFLTVGISTQNTRWAKYFYAIFISRRLILVCLPIIFFSSEFFQVIFQVVLSMLFIMYYAGIKPHFERPEKFVYLFNEVIIMLTNYHMMSFTSFVNDPNCQFQMGQSLQFTVIVAIIVNLGKMVYVMVQNFESSRRKKACQKNYEKAFQKILLKNVENRAKFLLEQDAKNKAKKLQKEQRQLAKEQAKIVVVDQKESESEECGCQGECTCHMEFVDPWAPVAQPDDLSAQEKPNSPDQIVEQQPITIKVAKKGKKKKSKKGRGAQALDSLTLTPPKPKKGKKKKKKSTNLSTYFAKKEGIEPPSVLLDTIREISELDVEPESNFIQPKTKEMSREKVFQEGEVAIKNKPFLIKR